jgi:hypothetical protein
MLELDCSMNNFFYSVIVVRALYIGVSVALVLVPPEKIVAFTTNAG